MLWSQAFLAISFIAAIATVAVFFIRARWPAPTSSTQDLDARKLAQQALLELCVVRDELSKERAARLNEDQETREVLMKVKRGNVNITHQVNDVVRQMTQFNLAHSGQQRRVG